MIYHLLLDLFSLMIVSMVFHELGHYLVLRSQFPKKKIRIIFDKKLYTHMTGKVPNPELRAAISGGIALGTVPVFLYILIEPAMAIYFAWYIWACRHDIKALWRARK